MDNLKLTKTIALPFYLNGFVQDHLPSIGYSENSTDDALPFLALISDWMFDKKLTPFLAVL